MSRVFYTPDGIREVVSNSAIVKNGSVVTGKTCEFDSSTNDFLGINSALPFVQSNTVGTIMGWWRMNNVTNPVDTLWRTDGAGSIKIELFHATGAPSRMYGRLVNSVPATPWQFQTSNSITFVNNKWYHLAMVQDGVEPKFYINGVEDSISFTASSDKTVWFSAETFTTFDIGGLAGGVGDFDGDMREFEIWDEVLSPGYLANYYDQYYKYF
jgi:hypothetical protein